MNGKRAGAPFGVVNAIKYSTDGRNLSFITVGCFESHSRVALLATWLGVNTSSAFSSLSSSSLFVVFFPLLFLRPCALIALKQNATFLISGQNKRKTIRIVIHELTSYDMSKILFQRKYSPLIALSQVSLFEHTSAHAVCKPSSLTLQIHCALIMLHFPDIIGLM